MLDNDVIKLSPFSEVIREYKAGKMILLADDVKRENEADLVVAAEHVTPEIISFMMTEARGLVCVSIPHEVASRLNLSLQAEVNNSPFSTAFTVSVDHKDVASYGVTAKARAFTIKKLLDPDAKPEDFVTPGHVFPLIADPAGVIGRAGHTEGSADLSRITGSVPAGVICEVLNEDGTMACGEELNSFSDKHKILLTTVAEIVRHRIDEEVLVREVVCSKMQTDHGEFDVRVFQDDVDRKEHIVLSLGKIEALRDENNAPLIRIHSECLTGDVFGSRRCDCGAQLSQSMDLIKSEGLGIVLYLRQEGRGIGLENKVKAYALQDGGHDTVEANLKLGFMPDERSFAVAAKILQTLGVSRVRLITNNPEKILAIKKHGIEVLERIAVSTEPDAHSVKYLSTKKEKLGHLL